MKIRQFSREDLRTVLAIQARCPEAARWKEADYAALVHDPGVLFLVAELETMDPPKILGFAVFHRVMDEVELRNLAVDPDHQEQGVGKALLVEGRRRLIESGARRVFLEARASNSPALRLYYALGFWMHSRRMDYYRDPTEDALVLCWEYFPPAVTPSPYSSPPSSSTPS